MVPSSIAWLVPIIIPFIIGLLIGVLISLATKLIAVLVVLIGVLVATGIITFSFDYISELSDRAMEFLPRLYDAGRGWLNVLPYSSVAFFVGLGVGLLVGRKT